MELSTHEFDILRRHVYEICGISIPDNKAYLIRQRLEPVVITSGCKSFGEFCRKITSRRLPVINEQIINAITTNETSFFRDGHPFVAINDHILPRLGKKIQNRKSRGHTRKGPKVSIWSAGSSTGQEAYSLAMLVYEYARQNRYEGIAKEDFGILATDISIGILSRAIEGQYDEMEVRRGLSEEYLNKFFIKDGKKWILDTLIRSMVEFRQINLVKPLSMLGGFDLILCRNVLIYFDNVTKVSILDQFYDLLADDGYLIIGATENLYTLTDRFTSIHFNETVLYQKAPKSMV